MEQKQNHELNTCERVGDFGKKHPLTPPNPRATILFGRIDTTVVTMRALHAKQDDGQSTASAGIEQRNALMDEVMAMMKPINEIAASLDVEEHPGVRGKFLMPSDGGLGGVLSRARSYLSTLEQAETKALFTERGLAATFDVELKAKVDALEGAMPLKYEGLVLQVGNTAGLKVVASKGLKAIRELNGILRQRYKNDPELLAAWDAARRVQRAAKRKDEGGKMKDESGAAVVVTPAAVAAPAVPAAAPAPANG